MSQIFLEFGNIRSHHPNLTKAIDNYVGKVLINDPDWPKDYKWDPRGKDWGWLSSTDTTIVPPRIQGLLNKHGFIHSESYFGEIRYEPVPNYYEDGFAAGEEQLSYTQNVDVQTNGFSLTADLEGVQR